MRSMLARRFTVVAATALVLAACGGDDGSGEDSATEAPTTAEETAQETASEQVTAQETTSPTEDETAAAGGSEGEQILAAAIGAADGVTSARTRVTSSSQTPQGDIEVVAEGVQSGGNSQMSMTVSGMPGAGGGSGEMTIEMIMLDGTVYQKSDALTSQLGTDAEWISFDIAAMGEQFASQLDAAQSADPSQTLEVFRDAGSVEVVGEEDVNGVATTHLVVAIPLRAALEAQGLDESAVGGSGVDADQTVEYDLWIDGDDMMRRMAVDLEVQGVTTSTTVDVLEYGVDVDIEAPPSDQVVSFSEMMEQAGNSGGNG